MDLVQCHSNAVWFYFLRKNDNFPIMLTGKIVNFDFFTIKTRYLPNMFYGHPVGIYVGTYLNIFPLLTG